MTDDPVTLESLAERIESLHRVLGIILLMLGGYPVSPKLVYELAEACGVTALPEERGH